MAKSKESARYTAGAMYGGKPGEQQLKGHLVIRDGVKKDRSDSGIMADFAPHEGKEAEAYASELKRETRGYKAGGMVRAIDGCAQRGKTRAKR